jgi:hypothetical protein
MGIDIPKVETLRDQLLELEIALAGKRAELELAESAHTEVPTKRHMHRAEADRQRRLMERLIHSRRPEAVARLETERGLA